MFRKATFQKATFQKMLCVATVLVLAIYLWSDTPARSQDDRPAVKSWRHLALTAKDQDDAQVAGQINQLGRDGWELVDVEAFVAGGETEKTVYFFKKPE